jgi:LssY C-terminus
MKRILRTVVAALMLLPAYGVFAYVVMPVSWRQYHRMARPADASCVTRTLEGIAADPLNVALVGTSDEVTAALREAGWCPADRITLRSGLRDATSVLFHRPYESAPVSTHTMWGRAQDLAFEQIVGGSPRRRHHVRLWRVNKPEDPRDTIWLGAATYDRALGFSRYTGEVVHHIETRVDAERDKLAADLRRGTKLGRVDCAETLGGNGRGFNGAGDAYETDGRLCVALPTAARRKPSAIAQELREAISRSWSRESASWAVSEPISAKNMSHCVSQGSPCVPRKASAAEPLATAVPHSTNS